MLPEQIPVVVISGPVGVGKSTVGEEVSERLEQNQIAHTFVDFDQLRYTWPRPADDPWGNKLGLRNLAALWRNSRDAGALNLVISYVVEEASFLEDLRSVIADSRITTIQLSASLDTLESRLRGREIGSGLDWHINRAGELSTILQSPLAPADHRIDTTARSVVEIAGDIVSRIDWRTS